MTTTASIALLGCIPAVLVLFACMRPQRAVIAAFLAAWLFLPMAGYRIEGLPDYTKMSATCAGVVLGVLIFDAGRLMRFRLHWVDLPLLLWCAVPFATSVTNGLGVYDGVSVMFKRLIIWALPYFVGRLYFTDVRHLRVLSLAMFIGGMLYVPLCLFEVRMSPQLHNWLYGYHQHSFRQTIRLGGFRPMVFMQHGLAVSMWLTASTVCGAGLWLLGKRRYLSALPMWMCLAVMAVTLALCRSINGIALATVGCGVLVFTKVKRQRLALAVVLLMPLTYMLVRSTGLWSGAELSGCVRAVVNERAATSLNSRMVQENLFSRKALRRPAFGWGEWNRMFPVDPDTGQRLTRGVDSMWIIAFGTNGITGLLAWIGLMTLPIIMVLRHPGPRLAEPECAGMTSLAVVLALYFVDCLFNGMINPVFLLASGGVLSCACSQTLRAGAVRAAPRPLVTQLRMAPGAAGQRWRTCDR